MTVQNLIVKNIASGNGSTTQWPFTFACPVDHPEYIKVYIKGASGKATATTDFSVNMTNKYVTYPVTGSVLASGEKIIIARELPLHQILNLVNQGPFYAEDLEVTYDELVMMIQQLNEQLGRSLKVGVDIDSDSDIDVTIPVPTDNDVHSLVLDKNGFKLFSNPGDAADYAAAAQNAANVAQQLVANLPTNMLEVFGYQYPLYTSFRNLGFNAEAELNATIHEIVNAMPTPSIAILRTNATEDLGFENYPLSFGTLYVVKNRGNVVHCTFKAWNDLRKWEGVMYKGASDTAYSWTGWEQVNARPIARPINNPRCCDEFVDVAESYIGKVQYGVPDDDGTINGSSTLQTKMDCQTLVQHAIEGIPFNRSKYSLASYSARYRNSYAWAMHPPKGFKDFCTWLWQNGWEIDKGIDYCNLQKGDLVLWGDFIHYNPADRTQGDSFYKNYRLIHHIAIFTGRWETDSNGTKHPIIIDSTTSGNGVSCSALDKVSETGDQTSHSPAYERMFIRLPLFNDRKCYASNSADSIKLSRFIINSYYHNADVIIKGNGADIEIAISTNNILDNNEIEFKVVSTSTGAESTSSTRVCTGYIPLYTNNSISVTVPSGYANAGMVQYGAAKNFLRAGGTVQADTKYMRVNIKNSGGTTLTDSDLESIKNGLKIEQYGALTTSYCKHFGSVITISAAKIPNGYTCKKWQGKYSISNDGNNWSELDSDTQTKLESICLYDGENLIRVLNGQEVEIY